MLIDINTHSTIHYVIMPLHDTEYTHDKFKLQELKQQFASYNVELERLLALVA